MSSPSITNFFKAQRKRPRSAKDDAEIVSAAKKFKQVVKKRNAEIGVVTAEAAVPNAEPTVQKAETVVPNAENAGPSKVAAVPNAERAVSNAETAGPSKVAAVAAKSKGMSARTKSSAPLSAVPAYKRFHSLAQKTPLEQKPEETKAVEEAATTGSKKQKDVSLTLPLPYNFKMLKDLFIAVETVIQMMRGRKEMVTFPKLKASVVELVRKVSLREKHLAQMATVLPGCYTFGLEKVGKEHHVRIDCEDLTPGAVVERRQAFHAALIKICLEHHTKYLLGLVPPMIVPADKQITRWHPSFKLDEIPDIIPDENLLPEKPAPEKASTARDVIAKAQNILENANPRMKIALQNMLNNSEASEEQNLQKPAAVQVKPKSAATLKSLKGVSSSLLEKIRNREKEKLINEITRSPAESKKIQMLKRLPQFVKIIRNTIVAEKKVALPMDTVIERVSHSIEGMSGGDVDAHLRVLATALPQWIKIVKLSHSDVKYLRIDINTDINKLLLELNEIIKKQSS